MGRNYVAYNTKTVMKLHRKKMDYCAELHEGLRINWFAVGTSALARVDELNLALSQTS